MSGSFKRLLHDFLSTSLLACDSHCVHGHALVQENILCIHWWYMIAVDHWTISHFHITGLWWAVVVVQVKDVGMLGQSIYRHMGVWMICVGWDEMILGWTDHCWLVLNLSCPFYVVGTLAIWGCCCHLTSCVTTIVPNTANTKHSQLQTLKQSNEFELFQ